MSTIIAGGFDHVTQAESATRRLMQAGISPDFLCRFRINPAGEHNALPAGGDRDVSPGAFHAHGGAVKGAVIGAAVGLAAGAAATPLLGPAGIVAGLGVGAYTGSLVGGLNRIDHEAQPGHGEVRPAETLLAVNVEESGAAEEEVTRILEDCGAQQIERAEGKWLDGEWMDFDPLSVPMLVGGTQRYEPRPTAGR